MDTTTPMPASTPKGRWLKNKNVLRAIIILVLLALLVGVGVVAYLRGKEAGTPPDPLKAYTVHQVQIPTMLTAEDPENYQIIQSTAKGHYLTQDTRGKLIYDGRAVGDGKKVSCQFGPCSALSRNGQHYAYIVDKELFVDDKSVKKNVASIDGVSDDGQHFMYTSIAPAGAVQGSLHRDNTMLHELGLGRLGLATSADLSHYILAYCQDLLKGAQYFGCTRYSVIADGKTIYASAVEMQDVSELPTAMSDNGQHYAYTRHSIDDHAVVIMLNGQETFSLPVAIDLPNAVQLTNTGAWALSNTRGVYVHSSLDHSASPLLYPALWPSTQVFINDDGTKALLQYDATSADIPPSNLVSWHLNDNRIDLPADTQSVEFDGNDLYLYVHKPGP
jgi:hypothetical protein